MDKETIENKQEKAEISYSVINYRWYRKQNLPYILIWTVYYAWNIAFATWWTASPLTENVFSTQLRELMHSVNLISSAAFIFIIRKEWFVKTARIGAVLITAGMISFLTIPNMRIQIMSAVISAIAMGCINISILIPFVFLLNNTEKLYAVVGSNVLIQLISLFLEYNINGSIELILSLTILITSLGATLFFKKNDIAENVKDLKLDLPKFHQRIYLTIFFNCAIVILCKGAGKGILNLVAVNAGIPIVTCYYIGGFIGCVLFVTVYAFSKKAFLWLGNITFASVAIGLFCYAFAMQIPAFAIYFAILLGIGNTVGMINMYYIIGVVGKKYNSMRYLQLSILLIGLCGGISGVVIGDLISSIGTFEISVTASVVSVTVMTLFMIVSPIIAQRHYENDWAKDSQHSEIDNEKVHIFLKYRMSKREIEVCKLLLQAYTMRQISGILSISYPTVNTYCTSIYRKIKINSRIELMQLFKDYTNK
jgi:DNA-binding CsgD family transcriptional regulator